MADLEQAIADKCAHFLNAHKNVLSAAEIADVLKQMGPVQGDAAEPSAAAAGPEAMPGTQRSSAGTAPKRLYQVREAAMCPRGDRSRQWRRRWHEGAYWWGHNIQRNVHQFSNTGGYIGQVLAGLMIPILSVLSVLLTCLCVVASVSLATTGAILGWTVAGSLPLWVAILILIVVFNAIAAPLRHAMYYGTGGVPHPWSAAWDSIFSLGVFALIGWLAYTHIPEVREFFRHFPESWQTMWDNIANSFHRTSAHKSSDFDL